MRRTATILFHARQQTHFWHLTTASYAEHKALGDFYEGILGLTDKLLETYQGKNARIDFGDIRMTFRKYTKDASVAYLKKLAKYLSKGARTGLKEKVADLNNILDEILELTNSTLYLLSLS